MLTRVGSFTSEDGPNHMMTETISQALNGYAPVRIAVGDKNPVVRAGLEQLIARDKRFDVVATVASGAALISLIEQQAVPIAVTGWSLPDMSGGEILSRIKQLRLTTRIIVYTGESSHDVLRQAIKSGAWGFVSKSEEPSVLLESIAMVARGRLSLPYVDIENLNHDPLEELTARERELLGALANGWTNLQIAARIGISRNTVKYHLKNLYDKLGVSNRAMAVALYLTAPRDMR